MLRDKKLYQVAGSEYILIAEDSRAFAGKAVYGNSHVKLIHRFYGEIESGGSDYIHPEEGVPSMLMIDAIRESSESGRALLF
jgi:predicted dehydrogenase